MASGPHTFITGVVFSAEKFQGNPLAIVSVRGNALSQERKQLIAKEFGYSETVFLHDAPGPGLPRRADIFTTTEEIPFAGHPVIGTAHYIFMYLDRLPYTKPEDRDTQRQSTVLMTKAGPVPVFFNPYRQLAACSVPHQVHIHTATVSLNSVLAIQPQIQIVPTFKKLEGKLFPIVSIVKGMTYALIDMTDSPESLTALKLADVPEMKLDEEWQPSFSGCMYYERRGLAEPGAEPAIHALHARMIERGSEDPGTGSACCALSCYLALTNAMGKTPMPAGSNNKETTGSSNSDDKPLASQTQNLQISSSSKTEHHVFAIQQGIEMGRKCQIAVEVDIKISEDGKREVENVILSGRSIFMMKGELIGM